MVIVVEATQPKTRNRLIPQKKRSRAVPVVGQRDAQSGGGAICCLDLSCGRSMCTTGNLQWMKGEASGGLGALGAPAPADQACQNDEGLGGLLLVLCMEASDACNANRPW